MIAVTLIGQWAERRYFGPLDVRVIGSIGVGGGAYWSSPVRVEIVGMDEEMMKKGGLTTRLCERDKCVSLSPYTSMLGGHPYTDWGLPKGCGNELLHPCYVQTLGR